MLTEHLSNIYPEIDLSTVHAIKLPQTRATFFTDSAEKCLEDIPCCQGRNAKLKSKKKIIRKSSSSPMISVTRSAATRLDAAQTNLKYRSQTRESRAWASALKSTDQRTTDWCHIHSVAVTQVIFVCFLTLQSFCTELYTLMDWQHRAHDTPGSELTHLNTLQYSPYRGHHLIFLSIKAKKWIVGS